MKVLFSIVCVAVAALLGYIAEPSLRRDLDRFFEVSPADPIAGESTETESKPKPVVEKPQKPENPEPAPPIAEVTPEPEPPAKPEPADSISDDFEAPPAPAPEPEIVQAPEPEPEPEPVVEEPAAPTETEAGSSDPDALVKIMQDSIRNGDIKEFKSEQVLEWRDGGPETIDGEDYETGIASYKAETIFGVKTIQAKALIQNGKLIRWVWPKSGMEIQ